MQAHLVDDVERLVFNDVEVAVVAVAWNGIAVFPIPFCVFHTYILSRDHLAVEEGCLCAVLLVIFLDESESALYELYVCRVVVDLYAEEFCSLHETVDTDSKVLAADVDEACIEERKHALLLESLEVLVVCELYLVNEVNNLCEVCHVVSAVLYRILDAAVKVDGEHAL